MQYQFHLLVFVFWVGWCALHSLMAAVWFKVIIEKASGSLFKFYRLFYSCIAAVSLIGLLFYQYSQPSFPVFKWRWQVLIIAIPFLIAGISIMISCIAKYFLNLSGVDVLMKEKREPVLETAGLHAYVRHPLYLGTLLFIWSLFLLFPLFGNLISCAVITAYTLIGIQIEERKLKLEFGQAYKTYASSIPMLIPSLRKSESGNSRTSL